MTFLPKDSGRSGRSRLWNILLVLLIMIAALVLAQLLWQLLSGFADIILLFILGWILSFVLEPVVEDLCAHPVPLPGVALIERLFGKRRAAQAGQFHISHTAAVAIVYLGLLVVVIAVVGLFIPPTVIQLTQLAGRLPEYMARIPVVSGALQDQLAQFGIRLNIEEAVRNALTSLQGAASAVVQNALGIFASVLNLIANIFLVLILGFYTSLDGARVRRILMALVPESFQREANYLSQSVNRTFGGFIRGQLVQALLQGIGTAVAMTALGLNFVLAASLFAILFMLIPLVGPALSLIPPLLAVLLQAPELAFWLLIALFMYQFIIVNILMPRVLSKAIGLHPLLVFGAILVGIKVGGFWGAFFGIPVAGVIWAMIVFLFEGWQRGHTPQLPPAIDWNGEERREGERREQLPPPQQPAQPQAPVQARPKI